LPDGSRSRKNPLCRRLPTPRLAKPAKRPSTSTSAPRSVNRSMPARANAPPELIGSTPSAPRCRDALSHVRTTRKVIGFGRTASTSALIARGSWGRGQKHGPPRLSGQCLQTTDTIREEHMMGRTTEKSESSRQQDVGTGTVRSLARSAGHARRRAASS